MRRKDREIIDIDEKIAILEKSTVLRIAFVDGNKPYIIPMNFGYIIVDDLPVIYLHGAKEGKKIDLINKNNNVAIEIDVDLGIVKSEKAEAWTNHYKSAIGIGKARIVDDTQEKITGLNAIMQRSGYEGTPSYSEKAVEVVGVIKIELDEFTAKAHI